MASQAANMAAASDNSTNVESVIASLDTLDIGLKAPSLVVNSSGPASAERSRNPVSRESGSDESHKADSSSELGTKPPSIDGKSITSGTTFALDEKESLRPDDSASVKAAAEDDDAFSIRGSLLASSRMGSEAAIRLRGIQLGDMPDRRPLQPAAGLQGQRISTPQSASSEQLPGPASTIPLASVGASADALGVIYRQAPDEKLLEALASPRDRLFLLRLEKDVIDFVQDSKEPYMDLPPSNSFCRMLTHKLADYYHMTHSYEPHIGSVRIFRTPFCRVPPSLALMSPQPEAPSTSTPPPVVLPKKIMRRGQEGESGGASASPSKPTSEDGTDSKDGKEKQPLAQKLTREEREEMYKLARERIFGASEGSVPDTDENGMSRASSVSANNKSNLGKRGKMNKQRRDDSDGFDSRNQYTPYWGPGQQTWVSQPQPPYAPPPASQFTAGQTPTSGYNGQVNMAYAQQAPGYTAPNVVPNPNYSTYPMPTQYPPQAAPPRYPPNGSPMTAYGSPTTSAPPQQNWQPGFTPPSYQNRGPTSSGPQSGLGIPYAYGQLPVNANPHDPKSQHPIPGSYNRNHAFNPKTQSFIPGGNTMPPGQPAQPPYPPPGSHHGSPQIGGAPHLAFQGYQPPIPPPYGNGYNMARQGSNHSMHAYHPAPPHMTPPPLQHPSPMQHPQHMPVPHVGQTPPVVMAGRPNIPPGPNQIYSQLPNYGNPATLPQKPAAGI
ncbi:hypothetical protein B0I35DRAFT_405359 [Stachybotrys elegans]|uniref:R3H domain-containing protein n=1 Tax=Stachybotrys elegans TaxID=80388 RepID=A0A8K0SZ30_9HYPO|nr:hypothetical protein B0I35DRAFT_405359 [Stachybotrys elegans]